MKSVTVDKNQLLEIVKKNRNDHAELFSELEVNYRERVIRALETRAAAIKDGGKIELYFDLPEPRNQTKDYDRVISMLEMSTDDKIQLSASEYDNYVRDIWSWTSSLASQSMAYGVDNAVSRKYSALTD